MWVKLMLAPTLASVTGAIIVSFYVTIRHEDVPSVLIPAIVYTEVALLGIVFWMCDQMLSVKTTSEAVIAVLTSITAEQVGRENLNSNGRDLKKYIMRRAKATRAMNFRVGDFMELSLDVPIGVWDEILNQVLLLLSF